MNKVILTGYLENDPVIVKMEDDPMLKFKMSTVESNNHKELHSIRVYGDAIEAFKSHLSKGDKILVEGKIRNIRWTNSENELKVTPSVLAVKIEYLSVKSQNMELDEA